MVLSVGGTVVPFPPPGFYYFFWARLKAVAAGVNPLGRRVEPMAGHVLFCILEHILKNPLGQGSLVGDQTV